MPAERRPIAARHSRWANACSAWLSSRRVAPNAISIGGALAAIAAGLAFSLTGRGLPIDRALWLAGAALVVVRLLANMLDGMVALRSSRASPLGELFNEVPDRVSDLAVLVGLGYGAAGNPTLGWLAAIIAIFVAYARTAASHAGAPADFRGPMAKQQRMAVVIAAAVAMAIAPSAWQQAGGVGLPGIGLAVISAGGIATAIRRLVRAGVLLGRAAATARLPEDY
ncbi:MAG: CDP-alcohol phosphatidyltransferase family protein [Chloroflexi bacterium]|nr:CDP-alcohol phosphatidyltransferase family protein [Chloroflexota bacterium]